MTVAKNCCELIDSIIMANERHISLFNVYKEFAI